VKNFPKKIDEFLPGVATTISTPALRAAI